MTKYLIPGLAAALLCGAAAMPAGAVVTVITLGATDCVDGSCGSGDYLKQTVGDSALADVSHRSTNLDGSTYEDALKFWSTGYGDLVNIAWGGSNDTNYRGEWLITAAAGYEVSLIGFDAGCYQNRGSCQTLNFSVTDLAGNVLGGGSLPTNWPSHTSGVVNSAYASGVVLTWGPGSYDVGLGNIAFDVRAVSVSGPVPEPASWAMMIGGLAVVGSAMRRRKTVASFA